MEGVERYKVRLLPHNKAWEEEFQQVKKELELLWAGNILDIQHFGSTSIRSIAAKPILDIAVVVKSFKAMNIQILEDNGYSYCGLQPPDNDRHLFVLRGENEISLQHIHCYEENNKNFRQCIGFRDYLNAHPEAAREYADLKNRLAELYPDDRIAYTEGKHAFIQNIYDKLGL